MSSVKSVLIVSRIDQQMSDSYVLPHQITLCETSVIYHILNQIDEETKQLIQGQDPLNSDEIQRISDAEEIMFFDDTTVNAMQVTFPTIVFDKTYFVGGDMITVRILQR